MLMYSFEMTPVPRQPAKRATRRQDDAVSVHPGRDENRFNEWFQSAKVIGEASARGFGEQF